MKFEEKVAYLLPDYHRYSTETLRFIFIKSLEHCQNITGFKKSSKDYLRLVTASRVLRYRGITRIENDGHAVEVPIR